MAQTTTIPKGTRDFNPTESTRRNYIFDTVKRIFTLYGYAPIETPAMENLTTLLGKYGDEGDKLLFKIQNSGADVSKPCEKGLRYDLTVPFARFVVQHQNEVLFPFKRYQLQPVWRADRPQKGRYREFYQCDVDVIGSDSLLNELELLQIVDDVFKSLGIKVCIKINNRKVLSGIADTIGCPDKLTDITVAIDKLDKIGLEEVESELEARGLSKEAILKLRPVLTFSGDTHQKLAFIKEYLSESECGMVGLSELVSLFGLILQVGITSQVVFDLSLARGLSYYTGAIFEVKALDFEMGSICGGGRYDNLTGVFGLPGMSGVGISFGADRIYDVLMGLNKFPSTMQDAPKVMFVNLGDSESITALSCMQALRQAGVSVALYPDRTKMKKQFDYADKRGISYVAIVGEEEIKQEIISLKDMNNGTQQPMTLEEMIKYLEKP
ncbi:MAG: histidine--tRNA ligase [Prevotellaceae bacterium]|jgi:histidyl-tRNA synthetase|nr:histidine--tRNA ligase [Prevotellaceae bacterium]